MQKFQFVVDKKSVFLRYKFYNIDLRFLTTYVGLIQSQTFRGRKNDCYFTTFNGVTGYYKDWRVQLQQARVKTIGMEDSRQHKKSSKHDKDKKSKKEKKEHKQDKKKKHKKEKKKGSDEGHSKRNRESENDETNESSHKHRKTSSES